MCASSIPHIPGHCPGELSKILTDEEAASIITEAQAGFGEDPFCPRHGKTSRPIEVPGLRCDCEENLRPAPSCDVLDCENSAVALDWRKDDPIPTPRCSDHRVSR